MLKAIVELKEQISETYRDGWNQVVATEVLPTFLRSRLSYVFVYMTAQS